MTNCTFTGNPLGAVGQNNATVTLTYDIIGQDVNSDCFGPAPVVTTGTVLLAALIGWRRVHAKAGR